MSIHSLNISKAKPFVPEKANLEQVGRIITEIREKIHEFIIDNRGEKEPSFIILDLKSFKILQRYSEEYFRGIPYGSDGYVYIQGYKVSVIQTFFGTEAPETIEVK